MSFFLFVEKHQVLEIFTLSWDKIKYHVHYNIVWEEDYSLFSG